MITVTSTAPLPLAGLVAEIEVSVHPVSAVPEVPPKLTLETLQAPLLPKKPLPVTVTIVPPLRGPRAGEIALTTGAPTYVNRS